MPREPRLRDYLTRHKVAALVRSSKKSPRHGARNHAMILLAYRHGLRASELVNLRMSDLDLSAGTIYCRRAKGSRSSLHSIKQDEIESLNKLLVRREPSTSDYVFPSERAQKLSRSTFWRIVTQAGERVEPPAIQKSNIFTFDGSLAKGRALSADLSNFMLRVTTLP